MQRDPFTLAVIALALGQLAFDRSRQALATGTGIALYLGYVLRIGGDFMAGRFFSAPFLVAVVWLAARTGSRLPSRALLALAPASLAILLAYPTSFRARKDSDCDFEATGIASERHCYSDYTALIDNLGTGRYTHHPRWQRGLALRAQGAPVIASTNVGMMGYVVGPSYHVIDLMALTDPLLARIPFRANDFRIGHFQRRMPRGYQDSVVSGENRIANPCIHAFYDQLLRVIRGPLFTLERARAVFELNLGRYDRLVQERCPKRATVANTDVHSLAFAASGSP
jgi:arabinofuranosyltransferase